MRGYGAARKIPQQPQNLLAAGQATEREFADYRWVRQHIARFKRRDQGGVAMAEVIDPNRCVDEDHT